MRRFTVTTDANKFLVGELYGATNDIVYNSSQPSSGNQYDTFAGAVAAANAKQGVKRIIVREAANPTADSGTLDLTDIILESAYPEANFITLGFTDTVTWSGLPLEIRNLTIANATGNPLFVPTDTWILRLINVDLFSDTNSPIVGQTGGGGNFGIVHAYNSILEQGTFSFIDQNYTFNLYGSTVLQPDFITGTVDSLTINNYSSAVPNYDHNGITSNFSFNQYNGYNRYTQFDPSIASTELVLGYEPNIFIGVLTNTPSTVVLPDPSSISYPDKVTFNVTVKDLEGTSFVNPIVISVNGGATIDGALTKTINEAYGSLSFELVDHTGTVRWAVTSTTLNTGTSNSYISTTDDTPQNVPINDLVLVPGSAMAVNVKLVAIAASIDAVGHYDLTGLFYKDSGGTVTQKGPTQVNVQYEDDSTWDTTLSTDGVDVFVVVQGHATETVKWKVSKSIVFHV